MKTVLYSEERLKNTYIWTAEYTSTGLLIPSKASHTLAQTMEYFQGYYKRLGFCVNKSKNQDHGYQGYTNTRDGRPAPPRKKQALPCPAPQN